MALVHYSKKYIINGKIKTIAPLAESLSYCAKNLFVLRQHLDEKEKLDECNEPWERGARTSRQGVNYEGVELCN